jgi:acetyltransferase
MRTAIDYARARGIREVFGEVLQENESMLKVNRVLGFSIRRDPEDPDVAHVSLDLTGTG